LKLKKKRNIKGSALDKAEIFQQKSEPSVTPSLSSRYIFYKQCSYPFVCTSNTFALTYVPSLRTDFRKSISPTSTLLTLWKWVSLAEQKPCIKLTNFVKSVNFFSKKQEFYFSQLKMNSCMCND